MSNNIIFIEDKQGNRALPITHERAVRDSSGVGLESKLASLGLKTKITAWDGNSTPAVANIPAGVVVTYNGTTYTGTLVASSSTDGKIYLVKNGAGSDRYFSTFNLSNNRVWSCLGIESPTTPSIPFNYDTRAQLVSILKKALYKDSNMKTIIDAFEASLIPPVDVVSISAVFTQPVTELTVYDPLDELRQYLVVTALYSDNSTEVVVNYTLSSGVLVEGNNTITVSYGGQTTTFTVYLTVPDYIIESRILNDIGLTYGDGNYQVVIDGWTNYYARSRADRMSVPYFDVLITPGVDYKYEIEFEGLPEGYEFQCGCQYFSSSFRNDALNEIRVNHANNNDRYDSGWINLTYSSNRGSFVFGSTMPKIAVQNMIGVRNTFRVVATGTSTQLSPIPDTVKIHSIKISKIDD